METKEKKQPPRERTRSRSRAQQDVVYTQPKPFNRKRFLLRLATVAAVAKNCQLSIVNCQLFCIFVK